jgi:hypothetical protein
VEGLLARKYVQGEFNIASEELAGSCPGPIYVLIGSGESSMFIVLISALFGTLLYGVLKKHLPH